MVASTKDGRAVEFARDDAHSRYTATVGGRVAAIAQFDQNGRLMVLTHNETDPAFEGQGVGSQLVRWVLDDVRGRGLHVVPVCPFVKDYIARHEDEYGDLVSPTTSQD